MSNKKYLDSAGLSYFWGKVKVYLQQLYAPISHTHTTDEITNLESIIEYLINGPADGTVRCVYNVTSTASPTTILGSTSNIGSTIYVDGRPVNRATTYAFSTTGTHTVDFPLSTKTQITQNTFKNCTTLVSAEIPSGVTTIGTSAFEGCTGLASIDIPEGVTTLGTSAFSGCSSLTSVTLPSTATSYASTVFLNCSHLNKIVIKRLTAPVMGTESFTGVAQVGTLYYPYGSNYNSWISEINGQGAGYNWNGVAVSGLGQSFEEHTLNKTIHITADERTTWNAKQDALTFDSYPARNSTNPVTSEGIRRAIDEAVSGSSESINCTYTVTTTSSATKLLDSLTGVSAIYIDGTELSPLATSYQFSTTGNHTVNIIPSGNSMPQFENVTSLSKVETIPNNITTIGDSTFEGCTSLYFINLPDKLSSIGSGAFYNCSELTTGTDGRINLPDSVERIGENAFYGCAEMYSLVLPTEIQSLGNYAFANNISLNKIIFKGPFCPSIGSNAFNNIAPSGTLYYNPAIEGEYSQSSLESLLPSGWTAVPIEGLDDSTLDDHKVNTTVHVNSTERAAWNAKYDLPNGGIPKTDLASAVQTSLGKADTAVQSVTFTQGNTGTSISVNDAGTTTSKDLVKDSNSGLSDAQKKYLAPSWSAVETATSNTDFRTHLDSTYFEVGASGTAIADKLTLVNSSIPKSKLDSSVQTSLGKADTALQSETDPVFTASVAHDIKGTDIANWNAKQNALTFDDAPTQNSTNPVKSGGIFAHTSDNIIHITSAERTTWNAKQNALTFDNAPTENSTNSVKSGAIYTWVTNQLAGITQISYSIVNSLPASGETGIIYLVKDTDEVDNGYNEFIWISNGQGGSFEQLGRTDLDLSGYITYTAYNNDLYITNAEIDALESPWPSSGS